ncbi:MAG: copper amine oxidase N-terminal domain-containing protein [Lutispora sp.]|jgi:hypothetical protein
MFKKHLTALAYLIVAVFIIFPSTVFAADIWSEPTYTEQWSQPTYTEQWSEPTYTEQWTEPTYTEPWSIPDITPPWSEAPVAEQNKEAPQKTPSIHISLQIGGKDAIVNGDIVELEVPPSVINGRTMVPIRFMANAIGAKIDWKGETQEIVLTLKDKKVTLTIGKNTALVNDRQVQLDAPPVAQNGTTLVPLRFVSENLDLYVKYIDAKQPIEISDQPFTDNSKVAVASEAAKADAEEQPSNNWLDESFEESMDDFLTNFENLYGTWYIWTPGSATNLYYKSTGNYATHEYNMGADQGKVVINKDGTYSMTHAAWDKDTTVQGKWRLSFPAEINGERIQAIVLLDGITNTDWAVAPSQSGKIRLLYAMRWADGSATWVFDSELSRK